MNKSQIKSAKRMISKYGAKVCMRAYSLHEHSGYGGYSVGCQLGYTTNTADALINAGRYLESISGGTIDFEPITLRLEVTSRGGGVEIDLSTLGFEGEKMSAYQNYLGGGMLGAVCVNDTLRRQTLIVEESIAVKLDAIGEQLKRYYHSLTNPEEGEWEHTTYEINQGLPESAF